MNAEGRCITVTVADTTIVTTYVPSTIWWNNDGAGFDWGKLMVDRSLQYESGSAWSTTDELHSSGRPTWRTSVNKVRLMIMTQCRRQSSRTTIRVLADSGAYLNTMTKRVSYKGRNRNAGQRKVARVRATAGGTRIARCADGCDREPQQRRRVRAQCSHQCV